LQNDFKNWCIEKHKESNHFYDDYLPYEFHLRLMHKVAKQFQELWETTIKIIDRGCPFWIIEDACFAYDLIGDTKTSYNQILRQLEFFYPNEKKGCLAIAEIAKACTNFGRGRIRDERMPDFVYEDIVKTPGAIFVKLADRIANVEYSNLTKSSMGQMYMRENGRFKTKLYQSPYQPMWDYLDQLFQVIKID